MVVESERLLYVDSECGGDKLLFGWVVILCERVSRVIEAEKLVVREGVLLVKFVLSLFLSSLVLTPH